MDIFHLLSYKLEHFLNIRPLPKPPGAVFYQEDETLLLSIAARKSNGSAFYAAHWHDLFPKKTFDKAMSKLGFTEPDRYALTLVLSRIVNVLDIDNRQRSNKDYFIFFYLIQLISLKNHSLDGDAQLKNHIFQFLLFELSIDNEAYRRFNIQNHQLVMATDELGPLVFAEVIEQVYKAIKAESRKEHKLLNTLKNVQISLVRFLTETDGKTYRLNLNDRYSELIYPDVFLHTYAHHRRQVFEALVGTVNPLQSTENLFVSNMILMNYAFHVLRTHPRDILKLKKFSNDGAVFNKVLEAIIIRRMGVTKTHFEKISTGCDLSQIKDDEVSFYNILYRL